MGIFRVKQQKTMKTKLLKKLRTIGRDQITVHSVTRTTTWRGEYVSGMSYGYNDDAYKGLFTFGDSEEDVRNKAMKIYFERNMEWIRSKYKKYSRKYKKAKRI